MKSTILSKPKKSNTNETQVVCSSAKAKSQRDFLCTTCGKYTKSYKPHIPTIHSQKAMETRIENKMTAKMHISDCVWLNYTVTASLESYTVCSNSLNKANG